MDDVVSRSHIGIDRDVGDEGRGILPVQIGDVKAFRIGSELNRFRKFRRNVAPYHQKTVGKLVFISPLTRNGIHASFVSMKGKFTAIIEAAPEGGYWAICPEVPGANGQGETIKETKENLKAAIRLIFEDRLADARRGLPKDAIQAEVAV